MIRPPVWDNHACMPLRPDAAFLPQLERYRAGGVDVVSLNLVFDSLPWILGIQVAATMRDWIARNGDRFALCGTVAEIEAARASGRLAITFDVEGMTALDGRIELVRLWYDLGVRWMLIAYNAHNVVGGGCIEPDDPGLSPFGRDVLAAMKEVGMVVCCSHTGERTTFDVFEHAQNPVILSHSNPRALCDHPRNVRDAVIDACAATGGVVGIVGFGLFLPGGDTSAAGVARAIDYVVQRVGPRHVGFSTDYVFDKAELDDFLVTFRAKFPAAFPEGAPLTMFAPEQFSDLSAELGRLGYGDADIGNIMGGNWLRIAKQVWKA